MARVVGLRPRSIWSVCFFAFFFHIVSAIFFSAFAAECQSCRKWKKRNALSLRVVAAVLKTTSGQKCVETVPAFFTYHSKNFSEQDKIFHRQTHGLIRHFLESRVLFLLNSTVASLLSHCSSSVRVFLVGVFCRPAWKASKNFTQLTGVFPIRARSARLRLSFSYAFVWFFRTSVAFDRELQFQNVFANQKKEKKKKKLCDYNFTGALFLRFARFGGRDGTPDFFFFFFPDS